MFEKALRLARAAHERQKRYDGAPYITHPIRVALSFPSEWSDHRVVAILHDVVEDTDVTMKILSKKFPLCIVRAVDAISRREEETFKEYIDRCSQNHIAREVKIADILDNIITAKPTMVRRYLDALEFLSDFIVPDDAQVLRVYIEEIKKKRLTK